MSSSTAYHLVGESSNHTDLETDEDDASPVQRGTDMGYRLGVFRACYVVALCSIGSFLFAYVRRTGCGVSVTDNSRTLVSLEEC